MTWKCFPCYWSFVGGIHRQRWVSHYSGPALRSFCVALLLGWTIFWTNKKVTDELRRHDVLVTCDVTVMPDNDVWRIEFIFHRATSSFHGMFRFFRWQYLRRQSPKTISATSQWVPWRLKSPVSWVFAQPFVQPQTKEKSFASLAFVKRIHRWSMDSPHKGSVTWKMFPFDDVIICLTVVVTHHSELDRFEWYSRSQYKIQLDWIPPVDYNSIVQIKHPMGSKLYKK